MTSTTFSNKAFPTLFKWAFKRNRPIMIIFSILMALGIILELYVLTQMGGASMIVARNRAAEYSTVGYESLIVAQVGLMFFTLISSLLTFSFLHNKRSVDMFGALPSTRGTMFVSHLLGGMAAVAAPFTAGSLIVMAITCRSPEFLPKDITVLLGGLVSMAAAYVFTALIAYCCGTTLDTTIVTIAVNAIYSGLVGLFWGLCSEMIPGLDFENIFSTPVITLLTPYAFCFFADFYQVEGEMTAFLLTVVWSVVFTAGVFFAALYAAKNRKAEVAQSEFDVKWLPMAIKAGGSVVCGGFIGTLAAMSSSAGYGNLVIYTVWYIIISFAAFFILHIILVRGRKGTFKRSFIVYVCTSAASLAVLFAISFGLGLDTYVPNASNVKSVTIDYGTEFKEPENIQTVTEIHKLITQNIRDEKGYPYYLGMDPYIYDYDTYEEPTYEDEIYEYDPENYDSYDETTMAASPKRSNNSKQYPLVQKTSFDFDYKKKVGFSVKRSYYLSGYETKYYDYNAIEELLRKLYNSEEYKRTVNGALWKDSVPKGMIVDSAPSLTYMEYNGIGYNSGGYDELGSVSLPGTDNFLKGLYSALQKDILADNEYYKSVRPTYSSDPKVTLGQSYMTINVHYYIPTDSEYYEDSFYYNISSYDYDVNVVVKSDYENTLKYLEENNIATSYSKFGETLSLTSVDDYIRYNDNAERAYGDFGFTGDYETFASVVHYISPALEYKALSGYGSFDEISQWDEAHGEEFSEKLNVKMRELYDKMINDPRYFNNGYRNDYLRRNYSDDILRDNKILYFCLEDAIITELDKECVNIVNDINASGKRAGV